MAVLCFGSLDRSGPDARASGTDDPADFELFIGFTTATAFSPTEAMPLTSHVKALMVIQSSISLVTVIIVAARAIGIIPT
ncbi:MAG TPA: hypothetical protein VGI19_03585 [Candidatus Cybelea sp.]|jgi:hypothetical protein